MAACAGQMPASAGEGLCQDGTLSAGRDLAVGVDIGGTKTAAVLVDRAGRIHGRTAAVTPARQGPGAILATVDRLVAHLRAAAEPEACAGQRVVACGVGAAGTIGADGSVVSATDILPGWAQTPLSARVSALTGLPVSVLNDVHAAAVGEGLLGAARGARTALVVAVGTGIGGALVAGGRLLAGPHGTAGSLGHMPAPWPAAERRCSCGAIGHVEPYASGPGIEQSYREAGGPRTSLRQIGPCAAKGDARADRVITDAARLLGRVIGAAVNLVDPDVVVIGGGVASLGERYLRKVREGVFLEALPGPDAVRVVAAELGPDAAAIGAGLAALDAVAGDAMR